MTLTKEQAALLSVQELDSKSAQLDAQLAATEHKRRIVAARTQLIEGQKRLHTVVKAVEDLKTRTDELQSEVDELASKIKEEQAKLQTSKEHRELEALSRELEILVKRHEKLENKELKVMEKRQSFKDLAADIEGKMTHLREIEAAEVAAYRALSAKVDKAKALVLAERKKAVSLIAPATLKRYEAIRSEKGGEGAIAVARYAKGVCGGCSVSTSIVQRASIEAAEEIPLCPTCKRLLVVEEN